MKKIFFILLTFISCTLYAKSENKVYNVADYGAIADGRTINTIAIQKAIDECNADGGGMVYLGGGGEYISGTLFIKSNVTLHVSNGTALKGSPNIADYPDGLEVHMYKKEAAMNRTFLFVNDAHSVAIEGEGTIDGNGYVLHKDRPKLISFKNSSNLRMNNITLKDPCAWTTVWLYCDDIAISGVHITSRANRNGDGFDFDGCTNVRVTNCSFDNSDDCICLQTSLPDKPCEDITISNCIFSTKWGGIRIGLLSRGDIKYVTVTNCIFKNIKDSGLKIQQCEGGEMAFMTFSNLIMHNVPRPVFMTFCQQTAYYKTPENTFEPLNRMHDFQFSNILVDDSDCPAGKDCAFYLTGIPDHKIENIDIRDVKFIVPGGGTRADAEKEVAEFTPKILGDWWPEFSKTGTLPAYGLYARHIDGLMIDNFKTITLTEDNRPCIVKRDVAESEEL